jgi:uncharacterized membrane protein
MILNIFLLSWFGCGFISMVIMLLGLIYVDKQEHITIGHLKFLILVFITGIPSLVATILVAITEVSNRIVREHWDINDDKPIIKIKK